jgi:AhpC/TSA family
MGAAHQKYQARGFETVAVAMRHDPPIRVVDYAERTALPFKVAFDPVGAHAKAFGNVAPTPTTFIRNCTNCWKNCCVMRSEFRAVMQPAVSDTI